MAAESPEYRWRFSVSPLADPDDDQWIHVEGGDLKQALYLRIGRTGPPTQAFGGTELAVTGMLINNGRQVTSTDLRLPLQRILEQFESDYLASSEPSKPRSMKDLLYRTSGEEEYHEWVGLMAALPEADPAPRGRGARPPTDDELRAFAAVYVTEYRSGSRGAVTRSAAKFGMHRVTAHKWIQRCRDAGILPDEESRR